MPVKVKIGVKCFFWLGLSLFMAQARAQSITSLSLIPNPILANTQSSVIAQLYFPYSSCPLISSSVSISGNQITVSVRHQMGMLAAICNNSDTLGIGMFSAGSYTLYVDLIDDLTAQLWDRDTLYFLVGLINGLKQHAESFSIKASPNPVKERLYLQGGNLNNRPAAVWIYNSIGLLVYKEEQLKPDNGIDCREFAPGTYLLRVRCGNLEQVLRFIKTPD